MSRLMLVSVFALLFVVTVVNSALADQFTIHLYDLNGTPLVGSGGRHNSIIVYQQDRGSDVNNLADSVTANIPKLRTVLGNSEDLDDDGILQVTINLSPALVERAIVIVIQRFTETAPTAVSPWVIVSPDNSKIHVVHIAVPQATMKAVKPNCESCQRRGLFRRRGR